VISYGRQVTFRSSATAGLFSRLILISIKKLSFYCAAVFNVAGSLQSGSEEEHTEDAVSQPHVHNDQHRHNQHHDDDDASVVGSRRRRSFYTPCQLAYLESAFRSAGHYPDPRQRQQLARVLDVTENRVQVCRQLSLLKCVQNAIKAANRNKMIYSSPVSVYYLRQGGNVFAGLCLFVCVLAR